MILDVLIGALIDVAYFLDQSEDEIINLDAAVQVLEGIAADLQRLNDDERRQVIAHIESAAAAAEPDRAQWLRNLPEALGLRE